MNNEITNTSDMYLVPYVFTSLNDLNKLFVPVYSRQNGGKFKNEKPPNPEGYMS